MTALSDLIGDRFDLAICRGPITDPDIVIRCLCTTDLALVASGDYAEGNSFPLAAWHPRNCIVRGTVETEGFNNYPFALLPRLGRSNAMRTLGDVGNIAQAIAYLCAPSGKFVTGEVLHIDGGMHLWQGGSRHSITAVHSQVMAGDVAGCGTRQK